MNSSHPAPHDVSDPVSSRLSHGADMVARASFGTVGFVALAVLPVSAFVGAPPLIYAASVLGVVGAVVGYLTWHRGHHALATWMHVSALLFVGCLSLLGTGTIGGLTVVLLLASVITAGGLQGLRAAVIDIFAVLAVVAVGYLVGPTFRAALDVVPDGLVVPEPLLLIFTLTSIPSWALYVIAIDRSNRIAWQRAEADRASLAVTHGELESAHTALQLGHEVQLELARLGVVSASAVEEAVLAGAIADARQRRFAGTSASEAFDAGAERIREAWQRRQELLSERAALARELQERARHEALERVTGGAAHDVNNALTGVIANSEQLRSSPLLAVELHPAADAVVQGAQHASRVVTMLGRYARGIPAEPSVCDAAAVVEEVRPLFASVSRGRVGLTLDVEARDCHVQVDRDLLERAVLNLVRNAVDAIPEGADGTVGVRLWRPQETVGIVRVEVRDTGRGMTPDVRAQSTEPYFSTGDGAGLGLTLVQGLANQSGGTLTVESVEGLGTRVRLDLPVAQAPGPPAGAPVSVDSKLHLLLVDDDEGVRQAIAAMCSTLGFRVTDVASGREAAAVVEREPPDLLLCDVRLKGENGFDLVRSLREDGLRCPVLFVTGFAGRGQSRAPSGDPVLVKPFRRAELRAAIEGVLAAADTPPS